MMLTCTMTEHDGDTDRCTMTLLSCTEKLHTPVLVDRTHDAYDADGLITWSPYRASDEAAHIVLPESQVRELTRPQRVGL